MITNLSQVLSVAVTIFIFVELFSPLEGGNVSWNRIWGLFGLGTLDHIRVFEDGTLLVVFLDGTGIECKNEEE